jgi:lipopolysaccharide export LptBFGC system permease protein LptF
LIVIYWALYITAENIARKGTLPPAVAIWMTNVAYSMLTAWAMYRKAIKT